MVSCPECRLEMLQRLQELNRSLEEPPSTETETPTPVAEELCQCRECRLEMLQGLQELLRSLEEPPPPPPPETRASCVDEREPIKIDYERFAAFLKYDEAFLTPEYWSIEELTGKSDINSYFTCGQESNDKGMSSVGESETIKIDYERFVPFLKYDEEFNCNNNAANDSRFDSNNSKFDFNSYIRIIDSILDSESDSESHSHPKMSSC